MFSSDPKSMQWLVDIRRDLHRHPEISHKEKRTTVKGGIVHSLHSPYFDIDETVLETGKEIFYEAVKCYLSPSKENK